MGNTIKVPETYQEDSESTQEEMQGRGMVYVEFIRKDHYESVVRSLEAARKILMRASSDISREMNSDESLGRPFNEDLGELDLEIKKYFNEVK